MVNTNYSFLSGQRQFLASLLFLAVVTLAVYSVSFFNGFVVDDEVIIVNNPQTLSLKNIPQVLLAPDLIKPYYRPLNRSTYLLDYRVAGMNPAWYHGVNILIHLGNVLLLYLVARRLLPEGWAALAAALLFAVHPVNSEAVNFISARNTLLSLFFSLASLLAYMKAREKGARIPLCSALLYLCGLLSKETSFMMIAVFSLAAFFPLREGEARISAKERLLLLSPYFIATAVYFAMRAYSLQGIIGAGAPAEGLLGRLAVNYHIIPQYLGLLLFPADLTLFHKVPQGGLFAPAWHLPVMLGLLFVIWMAVKGKNRVALFALAWVVINYAPISNVIPIPSDPITERYLYMPAVGFFLGTGVLFSWICSTGKSARILWAGTALVAIALSCVTVRRNLEWKSDLTLFSSGVRNDPASTAAHYNLGTAFLVKGDLDSARGEWEKTLSIDPAYADALTQMGTMMAVGGDLKGAERYYLAALAAPTGVADPDRSMAHFNLGKIYEKWGEPREALGHYRQFLRTVTISYLEYKPEAERRIARLTGTPYAGGSGGRP